VQVLTRRQREIYNFVREFIAQKGYSPTVFNIAEHFHLRATSTVTQHLKALEQAGVIIRGSKGALVQLPSNRDISLMTPLPFYGKIAAGVPFQVVNDTNEWIYVSSELVVGNCYALRVKGDSMVGEGILHGDLLIVRHVQQAEQGQTVVALIDGSVATVKKFYRRGRRVILQPANEHLRPLSFLPTQVEIQGVVQAVIRRY
jgi:repressor LexA